MSNPESNYRNTSNSSSLETTIRPPDAGAAAPWEPGRERAPAAPPHTETPRANAVPRSGSGDNMGRAARPREGDNTERGGNSRSGSRRESGTLLDQHRTAPRGPEVFISGRPPSSTNAPLLILGADGIRTDVIPQSNPFAMPNVGIGASFPFGGLGREAATRRSDGSGTESRGARPHGVDAAIQAARGRGAETPSATAVRATDAVLGTRGASDAGSPPVQQRREVPVDSSPKPGRGPSAAAAAPHAERAAHPQPEAPRQATPGAPGEQTINREPADAVHAMSSTPEQTVRRLALEATGRELADVERRMSGPVTTALHNELDARRNFLTEQMAMLRNNDDKYLKADPRSRTESLIRQTFRAADFRETGVEISLRNAEGVPLADHRVQIAFVRNGLATEISAGSDRFGVVSLPREAMLVPNGGTVYIRAEPPTAGSAPVAAGLFIFERGQDTTLHFEATTSAITRAESSQTTGTTQLQRTSGLQGQTNFQVGGGDGRPQLSIQGQQTAQQQTTDTGSVQRQTTLTFTEPGRGFTIRQVRLGGQPVPAAR